jgi:hypothetical protein
MKLSKLRYLDISGCAGIIAVLDKILKAIPSLEFVCAVRPRLVPLNHTQPKTDGLSQDKQILVIEEYAFV